MTKLRKLACLAALLAAVSGCGGSSASAPSAPSGNVSLMAGNWLLIATSDTVATTGNGAGRNYTFLRGPLSPSGNAVTATMGVASQSLRCYQDASPNALSGSVDNNNGLTLTSSSVGGSVLTITSPVTADSSFNGTYSSSAGIYCTIADTGTVFGTLVPPVDGTWSGTINSSKYGSIAVTVSIQQGAANQQGVFELSGTVTAQNYPCFTSGTIVSASSYIQGENVAVVATAANGAKLSLLRPSLVNPGIATILGFSGSTVSGGPCGFDFILALNSTLTKS